MPAPKKFGTFSGVFTPSILTILGVIMYLRLGWVVGQAGLIAALGIIVMAHVISLTTGLSISSIATDKKIKTGGIYYILSRSLGLPMGGSIGITIFIGTALSISLYIIGFTENFLSIKEISDFLGIVPSVDSYRIVGSVVLLFLVLIAFISTSFAIKTQYVILSAIALSLVSVFVGVFMNVEFHPATVALKPSEGKALEYVFAIFFPAVTGFTAGVALSGDLKDPKKNIPIGTMSAIIVGFVVYVVLAILFATLVDRDMLLNDNNFLMKIAWFSPIVVAGIWGATLSSALGGILGGPRIIQAISKDKITPKFLGKGYGINNEPRNALIFTFLLAEAGILIGELDIIAGIVSMFYIAAYGFINLAFALEKWASSDFRPSFRISKWVGIIGFVASFSIMFKIDTIAMMLSLIIMFGIYFFLKKKVLELDFGDVWRSVWQSVIRSSLHEMDSKEQQERNWQPNIMLFSSNTEAKPHLIEFGKDLVGRLGMLSNFDLIENEKADVLFPKHKQSLQTDDSRKYKGIFTRKQECKDYYEGVELISRTYGFSGIEPNTVLLNWEKQSKEPVRFAQIVRTLTDLDLNILMMDYDFRIGFGKRKKIDIWWRGRGNNGKFALSLVKFIWLSENWRDSVIRLLIVNRKNDEKSRIQKEAEAMLDDLRIRGEVLVINNEIVNRPFYEIIESESRESDLVILGIPDVQEGKEKDFIERTNKLCKNIGTVLLIKSSSFFKEYNVAALDKTESGSENFDKNLDLISKEKEAIPEIVYPQESESAFALKSLKVRFDELLENVDNELLKKSGEWYAGFFDSLKKPVSESFDTLESKLDNNEVVNNSSILKLLQNYIVKYRKQLQSIINNESDYHSKVLQTGIEAYLSGLTDILSDLPDKLIREIDVKSIKDYDNKSFSFRLFYMQMRIKKLFAGEKVRYKIKYRRLIQSYFPGKAYTELFGMLTGFGLTGFRNITSAREYTRFVADCFSGFGMQLSEQNLTLKTVREERKKVNALFEKINKSNVESFAALSSSLKKDIYDIIREISDKLAQPDTNGLIKNQIGRKVVTELRDGLETLPQNWLRSQSLLYGYAYLEAWLMSVKSKIGTVYINLWRRFDSVYESKFINNVKELREVLSNLNEKGKWESDDLSEFIEKFGNRDDLQIFFRDSLNETGRKIQQSVRNFPETIEIIQKESFYDFENLQFDYLKTFNISASQLLNYLVQIKCIEPLYDSLRPVGEKVRELDVALKEVISSVSFNADGDDADIDAVELIREQSERLIEIEKEAEQLLKQVGDVFYPQLQKLEDVFSITAFTSKTSNLKHYVWSEETKKHLNVIKETGLKIKRYFNHLVGQIWYRQSSGVIHAGKLLEEGSSGSGLDDMLNMIEKIKIRPGKMDKIPFYYRQLYLNSQSNLFEFWGGRKSELERAERSIRRFNEGYQGGIMITGDRRSGKTFFVQKIIHDFLDESKVYYVIPPVEGNPDKKMFRKILSDTFESEEHTDVILAKLPEKSVIVFDNLEFFFERSINGLEAIDELVRLISKFGNRHLFIVTMNGFTYEVLSKVRNVENYFLNIIRLKPLNAEELQEAVMIRHNSGSYKLRFADKKNPIPGNWDYAKLFSRYFTLTNGNVGDMMYSWIVNVEDVKDNYILINHPKHPDIQNFEMMETGWYVILVQMVLHGALSVRRLSGILQLDKNGSRNNRNWGELIKKLKNMERAGIIVRNRNSGLYDIDRAVYPYLIEFFVSKGIL